MDSFEFDGKRIVRSGSDLFFKTHLCSERWDYLKKPTDTFLKDCISALLANRAELVALYREAMAQAREAAMVCCSDARGVFERKLDALDARFKKLDVGQ